MVAKSHPVRAASTILLLLLSGLSEGVGILALLPVVDLAISSGSSSSTGVGQRIVEGISAVGLRPTLGALLLIVAVGLSMKSLLFLLAIRQTGYMAADLGASIRVRLLDAIMVARWEFFTRQPVGALSNAVGVETVRVYQMFTESCFLLANGLQVLVYAGLALAVSATVTAGAVFFGVLLALVLRFALKVSRRAGKHETRLMTSIIQRFHESLSSIKPLKAMAREGVLRSLLEADIRSLNRVQREQIISKAMFVALQEPLTVGLLCIGVYASFGAGIGFDRLLFLVLVFQRVASRIGNTQSFYQSVSALEPAFNSVSETLASVTSAAESSSGSASPSLKKEACFRDVSFSYSDGDLVLAHFDLVIPARQVTALLGPSGSGKTTVADLLIGLLHPREGDVTLDGVSLRSVSQRAWRSSIGYVPQETLLLNDTIFQNVSLGDRTFKEVHVRKALMRAGAWTFVQGMTDGMQARVGERGAGLSGGQRQRIAIARALIGDPLLLILDEATTALDPATEADVLGTIQGLKKDMTILAISHQPAVRHVADQVVELQPLGPGVQ